MTNSRRTPRSSRSAPLRAAGFLVLLLGGCSPTPPPTPQEMLPTVKFKVIALTTQLAELATEIGGEAVLVECPITAQSADGGAAAKPTAAPTSGRSLEKRLKLDKPAWNANPFTWEPTASDLFSLQTAHMVLMNGLGVEKYLDGEIASLRKHGVVVVIVGEAVPPEELIMMTGEEKVPHALFFNSPRLWKHAVTAVVEGMKTLVAPEAAPYFDARANPVFDRLDRLEEWTRQKLAGLRAQGRGYFITSHDSLAYFWRDFGLEGRALVRADGGPLPFDKVELDRWLAEHAVTEFLPDIAASKEFVTDILKDNNLKLADPICGIYLNRPGTMRLGLLETHDTGTYEGAFRAMVRVLERTAGKPMR